MAKAKAAVHSANYEKVRYYYGQKLRSMERLVRAVGKWITEAEYEEITGSEYPAEG